MNLVQTKTYNEEFSLQLKKLKCKEKAHLLAIKKVATLTKLK